MIMTSRVRKFALTAHVIFAVGWLGAIAARLTAYRARMGRLMDMHAGMMRR